MRRPVVIGNWKMHGSLKEAAALAAGIKRNLFDLAEVDIAVCPPFPYLLDVRDEIENSPVRLGAQDCYWEPKGAFTGEVSVPMLKDAGCAYVLCGHSERRHVLGESNEWVRKKVAAVLAGGLTPVLCVGEKLDERERWATEHVVREHVEEGMRGLSSQQAQDVVIAYEPVWAIGTGKTATPDQAQEVHAFIRKTLGRLFGEGAAQAIRLQYGGSVKPDNVDDLMSQPDVDGVLVGGASLDVESFTRIAKFRRKT
ncbi:MAG: triose-phosphate isomerase [Planctomycetota bacterium]